MICFECKRFVRLENHDLGICASCNRQLRDIDRGLYPTVKEEFLKKMVSLDKECPVKLRPITMDDDVHHRKGRIGFADQWARDNDISLLIDVRFFLAVSREGHIWIEHNREEAEKLGYTLTRQDTHNG